MRRFAELNFCPKCYQTYLAMFEGQIERLALDSLFDRRTTESLVTQMVMKHKGAFKSKTVFLAFDDEKEASSQLKSITNYSERLIIGDSLARSTIYMTMGFFQILATGS